MGNIRIVSEGLETCDIAEEVRDNVILQFFRMKDAAEKEKDKFFVTEDLNTYCFSYGNFYSDFVCKSWKDIQTVPTLKGIAQNTYQLLYISLQKWPKEINDDCFVQLQEPRVDAGFRLPKLPSRYIYDLQSWREWRHNWLVHNQDKIDWSKAKNNVFPNPSAIDIIIKEELLKHGINADDDFVHVFHDKVVRCKGPQLAAYAEEIGSKICHSNYYIYERELSRAEHLACGKKRKIFSILNREREKQYLSIDFAHGIFELVDNHNCHIGEYRFDGSNNSSPEEDHSFRSL